MFAKDANLSIPRYVRPANGTARSSGDGALKAWAAFDACGRGFWQEMDALVEMLDSGVGDEVVDV